MSKAIKAVTGAVGGIAGSLFGGGSSPGIMGTGRFKGATRKIDKSAFALDPNKTKQYQADRLTAESEARAKNAQAQRSDLISDLRAQTSGTAPSLAEAQLKSASDRSLAQQLAAAQAARGGSAASRERQLMQGQAQAGRELAQDATTARLQERQMAQQLLGDQIGQEQAGADALVQNYMNMGFNFEQARQQAAADYEKAETAQFLQAQGLTAQGFEGAAARRGELISGAAGAAMAMSDKDSKKNIKKTSQQKNREILGKSLQESKVKEKSDKAISNAKINTSFESFLSQLSDETKKINIKSIKTSPELTFDTKAQTSTSPSKKEKKDGGGGMEAAAKLAPMIASAFSDEKTKISKEAYSDKNIKKDFLDKLEAYTYEYKDKYKNDPRGGEGTHMSVMAQDLEKAGPIGKSMVKEDVDGVKVVDYAKGYGAILAAQAHLNKRLDELQKKKKA